MNWTLDNVSLAGYAQLLAAHDWTHAFSDDHRVWQTGNHQRNRLRYWATLSDDHAALYHLALLLKGV